MTAEAVLACLVYNVKRLRKSKNWTQEDLAEKADVSSGFLKKVESGLSWCGTDTLTAICEALDVGIDELFAPPPPSESFDQSTAMGRRLAKLSGKATLATINERTPGFTQLGDLVKKPIGEDQKHSKDPLSLELSAFRQLMEEFRNRLAHVEDTVNSFPAQNTKAVIPENLKALLLKAQRRGLDGTLDGIVRLLEKSLDLDKSVGVKNRPETLNRVPALKKKG